MKGQHQKSCPAQSDRRQKIDLLYPSPFFKGENVLKACINSTQKISVPLH